MKWIPFASPVHVYVGFFNGFLGDNFFIIFTLGAIPSDEQIRLTPSMTNKKGWFIVFLYFTEQAIDWRLELPYISLIKCKLLNSYVYSCHSCLQRRLIYAEFSSLRVSHVELDVCSEYVDFNCIKQRLTNIFPVNVIKLWRLLVVGEDHGEVLCFVFGKQKSLSTVNYRYTHIAWKLYCKLKCFFSWVQTA